MISKILVVSAFTAGLAALPMLASAQTSTTTPTPMPPMTSSGTMATHTQPMTQNMGHGMNSGSMAQSGSMNGNMNMGSMNSGSFNPHNYRSTTDCLNAAAAAHVSLSSCGNTRGR